jgi:flagellar basal-body rod protein FlgF
MDRAIPFAAMSYYGLYISAEGAHAQSRRVETLANNLANADTVGFKRDFAVVQARYAEEMQRGLDYPGSRTVNDLGGGVRVAETKTDFSPGAFKRTGNPTDIAIPGDGFFMVRRPDGDYLTRAGNFMFNSAGRLVTQDNDPVLSDSGAPIDIDPDAGDWRLTGDGGIVQNGTQQNLALVKPRSLGDLSKVGQNLFKALAPAAPIAPEHRQVDGGFLEQSDVKPTTEMTELIEASRAFEANISMIKNHDQMMGTLTSRLLKFS